MRKEQHEKKQGGRRGRKKRNLQKRTLTTGGRRGWDAVLEEVNNMRMIAGPWEERDEEGDGEVIPEDTKRH